MHEDRICREWDDDIVDQMLRTNKVKKGKSNKRVESKSAVSLKQLAISSGKIKKIEIVEVYLMSGTTFAAEEIKELMKSMILL